jgi:hypothetical protein
MSGTASQAATGAYVPAFATTATAAASKTTGIVFASVAKSGTATSGTATASATALVANADGGVDSSSLLEYFTRVRPPFSPFLRQARANPPPYSLTSTPTPSPFRRGATPTPYGSSSSELSSSGRRFTTSTGADPAETPFRRGLGSGVSGGSPGRRLPVEGVRAALGWIRQESKKGMERRERGKR